ncbi:16S rRNA (cytidine(1402)-2'-O)-methyltransferase [Pseudohongiella acticola]|jgi:16S rRNA (cytidine1402-2'-O)-methyltransferase|uniref:Ribosomal RNA small subunit methyltransferase I n=1 Tax=Pseudohongiella acticola TaxID=1524254 RepID=A0A1E8CFB5_9GAMM|nr:16S rRNA (cytidine(1402)-2'-O)-methyltransferase [Pseudohongiella acticola]OFE11148.1 16S rRNA (cytidine(1402)-2'-O)-methyltransferase [Pseudohongiella acticola]
MTQTFTDTSIVRPALYVVATPIGNLGDLSQRAVDTLKGVDLIAAEDTRHSARLMQHFAIATRLVSYHEHSGAAREDGILRALGEGKAVALISDAGTPLISDPGYGLVVRVRAASYPVVPVPGASAITAAISAAGLPSDRFCFEGFPPHKAAGRRQMYEALADDQRTLVFYESPHRISDSVADMAQAFGGDRQAVICRELTKTWETIHGDSLAGLCEWLQQDDNNRRGEFVVVVHGAAKAAPQILSAEAERTLKILLRELPLKTAAALAAEITGNKKNALYKRGLELAEDAG